MMEAEFFSGPLIAAFLLVVILFLYRYLMRNFDYWKKRGIPYVKPLPIFGSTYPNLWKPFHEIELERYLKYGPLYGHFEGSKPVITVCDLKLVREVLVKEFFSFSSRRRIKASNPISDCMLPVLEGEDWKRVRSIVSPTFTTGKIKRMVSIVKDCSEVLMRNFKSYADKSKPCQVRDLYGAFALDVIASSAFSTKLDSHNDPENTFAQMAKRGHSTGFTFRFALYQVIPRLMKLLRISLFDPVPMNFFKDVILQIIAERKRTGQTRNDFLQLLIDTAREVTQEQKCEAENEKEDIVSNYVQGENIPQVTKNVTNKHLSMEELIGQCVIFLFAGYDTTASSLAFASYLLALHPNIQNKVYEEIRDVLNERKGELTYEALQEMKYLDNVISESLRLYPPATRLERVADMDCKLGDTGLTIPKDMVVTVPNYALHRDPKFFPNPDEFDPDRFTVEERAKRDPMAYLPFGAGPRNCVGMRFALMEMKVCLVYVIANFEIHRSPLTKVPLEFHRGPMILIAKEVLLKIDPRENKIELK